MPTFTPPTDDVIPPVYVGPGSEQGRDPSGWRDTTVGMQRLMSRYVRRPQGRNVFLMMDGSVTEDQPPNWDPSNPTGPYMRSWDPLTNTEVDSTHPSSLQVRRVYWGGSANPITADEATTLTAAGYGAYIT